MAGGLVDGRVAHLDGIELIAARGDFEALVHFDFRIGDVLVLIAAATLGAYTVLLKKAKFALARLPLLVLILGSAAVVTFPLSMFELWRGDYAPGFELSSLIILAYIGIPGGALVYLFFNWSIDVLGASRAGMLLSDHLTIFIDAEESLHQSPDPSDGASPSGWVATFRPADSQA